MTVLTLRRLLAATPQHVLHADYSDESDALYERIHQLSEELSELRANEIFDYELLNKFAYRVEGKILRFLAEYSAMGDFDEYLPDYHCSMNLSEGVKMVKSDWEYYIVCDDINILISFVKEHGLAINFEEIKHQIEDHVIKAGKLAKLINAIRGEDGSISTGVEQSD